MDEGEGNWRAYHEPSVVLTPLCLFLLSKSENIPTSHLLREISSDTRELNSFRNGKFATDNDVLHRIGVTVLARV
jgi:hypothetical protein